MGLGELLGQMFSGIAGGQDGVHTRIWGELKPWLMNLGPAASRKWIPRVANGEPCEVPVMANGRKRGDCHNFGLATCAVCRRPVCLQHAHIDQHADAICYVCVADAVQVVPPLQRERARTEGEPRQRQRPPPGEAKRQQQPPPNAKPGPSPEQVLTALKTLGLKPGSDMDAVRAAHRKLSAQNHPDRKRTAKEKAAAEARFVEVQKAFEVLKAAMK